MLDYKKMNELLEKGLEEEKFKNFELGLPWVYGDDEGKYIIEEFKNGSKRIYRKEDRKLLRTESGKEGYDA